MNLREFSKLVASKLSPTERAEVVKQMIKAVVLPSGKHAPSRRHHQRAGNARYAARRRQKDSRKEQQRKGLYRRAC